jgi:hypothetical protein
MTCCTKNNDKWARGAIVREGHYNSSNIEIIVTVETISVTREYHYSQFSHFLGRNDIPDDMYNDLKDFVSFK